MYKNILFLLVSIGLSGELETIFPQEVAMGGTGIATCFSHNPAAQSADRGNVEFSRQKLFGLKEISHNIIGAEILSKNKSIGVVISQLSVSPLTETMANISSSIQFFKTIQIGLSIGQFTSIIHSFNVEKSWLFSAGMIAKITKKHTFGFVYKDLMFAPKFGFGYEFQAQSMRANFDWIRDIRYPISFRIGFEKSINNKLFLRCGHQTEPSRTGVGFGLCKNRIIINYALRLHQQLPTQHQLSFQIKVGKIK